MSSMPMDPSVACLAMFTALLRAAIDLLDLEPAVPTVDACWLVTSAWLCTESLESLLKVPSVELIRFRLFARRTMVATVLQYSALANESLMEFDWKTECLLSFLNGRRLGADKIFFKKIVKVVNSPCSRHSWSLSVGYSRGRSSPNAFW